MTVANTVCLCGSTKFIEDFNTANRELTKLGLSVITISFAIEKDAAGTEKEPALKEVLDLVHFNKILRADAIVVVGPGYIGFSTAREIIWANMQGKDLHRQYDYIERGITNWSQLAEEIGKREPVDEYNITELANKTLREKAGG